MTKLFILNFATFLVGVLLISSCDTPIKDSDEETNGTEKRDTRFVQCYFEEDLAKNNCDSVLITIFGESMFKKNVVFEAVESTMNCEVDGDLKLVPFGNREHCLPNSYDLKFTVQENEEAIFPFQMVAGKDMQFELVSTIIEDQLRGYLKLLKGEFSVDYSKAKSIAMENGVDFNESYLELVRNESDSLTGQQSYHWEAELEYDHNSVSLLQIDPLTGETRQEVITIEQLTPKTETK